MHCRELEPLIEAIADGSHQLSGDDHTHLSSCAVCSARLEQAGRIEDWLAAREVAQPPAAFTASVMARIGHEKWQVERVIDIGFNLAIAAGVLVILLSGAGLAWSLGFFTITVDAAALLNAALSRVEGRAVISEVQTLVIAAALLTMALAFWWWAEAATD